MTARPAPSVPAAPAADMAPAVFRSALLALAAAGLFLRLWGLDFGLPLWRAKPEEELLARMAFRFLLGDLNPHEFFYGSLHPYLLAAAYTLRRLSLGLAARDFVAGALRDPSSCLLLGRALSAAAGAAGVWATGRAGEVLFGRRAGAVAAAFWAAAYLPVREAHFAVTDSLTTLLIQLSFLWTVLSWRGGRTSSYVAAGLLAGLAASSKYIGVLLVPSFLVVHFLSVERGGAVRPADFWDRRLLLFFGALAAGFLLGTPYALPEWRRFLATFAFQLRYGQAETSAWDSARFFVGTALGRGLGSPLLAAALAGAGLLALRERRTALVLFLFPAIMGVLLLRRGVPMARYALPAAPFLCLSAAYAVATAAGARGAARAAAAAGLLLIPSLMNDVAFDRLVRRRDSRLEVLSWMAGHVPAGRSVAQSASPWGRVPLEDAGVGWPSPKEGVLADVLLVERYPALLLTPRDASLEELIRKSYVPAGKWEALAEGPPRAFDPHEMFYLPFAGFEGVERPGPNWELYVRPGLKDAIRA